VSVAVTLTDLTVDLGGKRILDRVSLAVPAGSFVTLLGPSGSGKTTTLNVLAGFVRASGGQVRLGDRAVDALPPHRRDIGFVFQNYALFPHLDVAANVGFPLRARRVAKSYRAQLIADALALVQLPEMARRPVRSLSGGQQQRVALARALVFSPSLLLLDEPLAALDKRLREMMQFELKRIQASTGVTTIAVTHDQTEALSLADQIAIMNEGRLEQVGTPAEVYRRPATPFVATFLGEANLLPASAGGGVPALGLKLPADSTGAAEGHAVVRPEDLVVTHGTDAAGPGVVEATVVDCTYQGARSRLRLAVPGHPEPLVAALAPGDGDGPRPGDRALVAHRGGPLHVVAAAG
jgi:putative spermidine/putrescine transport system ATP-binding protein